MDGLVSLLLFAGAFFLMMRYGCGAHIVHGKHGRNGRNKSPEVNHVDPVCGTQIIPDEGYGLMHDGKLYRFCSRNCLDKFEEKPEFYLK